jgi:YD repeat-containing protein
LLLFGYISSKARFSPADTAHAYFLAVDPTSGDLHISLPLRRQVWKVGATDDAPVDATANYQVVVGDGNTCAGSTCGDGGPADIASLSFPKGIAFDARGALFIADGRRVRVVTADKLIRTLVAEKTWTPRPCFADIDVSELNLEWPTALAVDPLSQMLLVLDADVIYRIDVAAELARVEVGAPAGCDSLTTSTNDTLAVVRLHSAKALVADDQGTLLVVESNGKRLNQVRAFGRDGRPTLIAGKTSKCDCDRRNCPCDNDGHVLARDAHLHQPVALAVDSAGTLHIADQANFKIKSMRPLRPDWDAQQRLYNIVSADTNEIYLFNGFGQHVATQSLLSAQFVYNFTYHIDNSYGRLLQVIGGGGHRLYFVRRSDTEIQIETSHAVKTTLQLGNFDQMLETVALPDGGFVRLDHDAVKGLLLSKVDADGRAWFYDYDADGRADRLVTPTGDTFRVVESVVGHQLVSRVEKNGRLFSQFAISPSEMSAIGTFDGCGCSRIEGECAYSIGASNRRVLLMDGGFYVDANGYRSQFDGSDHPLLAPHESTLLKRKATLPSLTEPQRRELTSRLEWRNFVRREGKGAAKRVAQVGRRPRVRDSLIAWVSLSGVTASRLMSRVKPFSPRNISYCRFLTLLMRPLLSRLLSPLIDSNCRS